MTDNNINSLLNNRNLIVKLIPCKTEIDTIDITSDVDDAEADVSIPPTSGYSDCSLPVDADSTIKIPLIFNEKYFKIITTIGDTAHQRAATGVLASCQLCTVKKHIKGSLKITSNFIQHLKSQHYQEYQEYLTEKKNEKKKSSYDKDKQRSSTQYVHPLDDSSEKPALIFNGEYFKIIEKIDDTDHQKSACGVIAACQLCANNTRVKGSLAITSNFVQHLRAKHPTDFYTKYLIQKKIEGRRRPRRYKSSNEYSNVRSPSAQSSDVDSLEFKFKMEQEEIQIDDLPGENDFSMSEADSKGEILKNDSYSMEEYPPISIKPFSSISTYSIPSTNEDSEVSASIPLIFNGKYFKIVTKITNTDHQGAAEWIIADCQLCESPTTISGSLKATSNFVEHLSREHQSDYETYLIEKTTSENWPIAGNQLQHCDHDHETSAFSATSPRSVGPKEANSDQLQHYDHDTSAFSVTSPRSVEPTAADSKISIKKGFIFSNEYFKIIRKVGFTAHERAAQGIIAVCQICKPHKKIKGSLKITSNFVQHLRRRHPAQYATYILKRKCAANEQRSDNNSTALSLKARSSSTRSVGPTEADSYQLQHYDHDTSAFSAISTHSVGPTEADSDISTKNALIFSNEYFKIIRKIGLTAHEREAKGIIAACQICRPKKKIKGSLKYTGNFVQHLRRRHPARYATYILKKNFQDKCAANEEKFDINLTGLSIKTRSSTRSKEVLPKSTDFSDYKNMNIIFNGEFFDIIKKLDHTAHQRKTKGVIAACQLCIPHKKLRGSLLIRSNFVEHLKRKHPAHYKLYIEKNNAKEKYRLGEAEDDESSASMSDHSNVSNHSESILPDVYADPDKKEDDVQSVNESVNEKLLAFLGDSFLPLSLVENPSFRSLFGANSSKVCNRRYVADLMQTKYTQLKKNIKDCLKNVPYVCTTADIWSSRNRFYFGYTCHWIDSNLNRQSVALACRNLNDNKRGQIADLIQSLNIDFDLDKEKVACTITGNGSNFLKAFKEFGIKDNYEIDEDDCSDDNSDDVISFVSDQPGYTSRIPKNYKCGNQTLIEFATIDFARVLKANKTIYNIHQTTLQRCSSIWDKCNRPETVEITKNLLNLTLKTPNSTCWNSLFYSLEHLIQCKRKLDDICLALGVPKFNTTEVLYIEEYCLLMEPISVALEFLQNEKDIYYGYFLPILVSTKVKLRKLYKFGNLTHLKDVAKEMEMALVKRFRKFFEISPECYDSVISAIACPLIKMRFSKPLCETSNNASFEDLKLLFIRHAEQFQEDVKLPAMPEQSGVLALNAYFDFDETTEEIAHQHNKACLSEVRKEVERYLSDEDCSLDCLHRYPIVKKMFMKYNTPLPSSSPVERLFSFEGITNRQRRQNLSAEHFERGVIMGANKIFDFN